MKNKNSLIDTTVSYYEKKSSDFIESYEAANMDHLYAIFNRHITNNANILDIGFGSGRDLKYLKRQGFHIWGIDPTQSFVNHAKIRFPDIADHFFKASLPNIDLPNNFPDNFDYILLIAVWMHLPKEIYIDSIKALCALLRPRGKIILSYSITPRQFNEERYFENIDRKELEKIFKKYNCIKIDETINGDSLSNRDIIWVTEVYKYDKY